MEIIHSHLGGTRTQGSGDGRRLYNPTTEDVLAETRVGGYDYHAALAWARERGGPALRDLTFAQRGRMLAGIAAALHAQRDALIEIAVKNGGNTRGDAKFDIDGASATLAHYAELGDKLGARRVLADGEMLALRSGPRWVGQHVRMPRVGVAVLINAFNFPAWGMLEKAAAALLAGMPVLSKAATSTALLAARIADIIVESGLLPEGAFSFTAGPAGPLALALDAQDVLAFTGSAETGARLRAAVPPGVRLNIEADSLNGAVLGPDVAVGSETYEMFLRDVVREMTPKAGQKCTAIRRIFVPAPLVASVRGDLCERLGEVVVGDPALAEVKMGPLASSDQLVEARRGLAALEREARRVFGAGGRGRLLGVAEGRGYFLAPVLLETENAEKSPSVHTIEVFAPVATLLTYGGSAKEAARLLGLGGGSLVASVYGDDDAFAAELVLGAGAHHGRLFLGNGKIAEQALGPGAVLPSLLHGGPGRAGGGQELGGLRGLELYMQCTALQGPRPLVEKLVGGHG